MVDVKWEENQGLDESAEEVVNYCKCSLTETPCNFPYCEADLLCEQDTPETKEEITVEVIEEDKNRERVGKCTTTPTGEKSNSELFFEYQKRLDKLAEEEREIENHKKEVFE